MTTNHLFLAMIMTMTTSMALTARDQDETYRFDLGVRAGVSGYSGDLSSNFFKHPGMTAGVKADYIFNPRCWAGANFSVSSLSGTIDKNLFMPLGTPQKFKATAWTIDGRFNFNFMPYGTGATYQKLSNWTPYVTVGVGMISSRAGNETAVSPTIPLGVGVRYRVADRVNLSAEFVAVKTFSDSVDGKYLNDPLTINSAFAKNTDWLSGLTLTLSYEMGRRCSTCHHID